MSKKNKEPTSPTEEGASSFAKLVHDLAHGDLNEAASVKMQKLLQSLKANQRQRGPSAKVAGKLVVELTFIVEELAVSVGHVVKTKEPDPPTAGDLYYLSGGGNLSKKDPRQEPLPFRDVNAERAVRESEEDTTEARSV